MNRIKVTALILICSSKCLTLDKIFAKRALEFISRVKNNQIQLPTKIRSELAANPDKDIRVIVLIEDGILEDDKAFKKLAHQRFLDGYAESDAIYDQSYSWKNCNSVILFC